MSLEEFLFIFLNLILAVLFSQGIVNELARTYRTPDDNVFEVGLKTTIMSFFNALVKCGAGEVSYMFEILKISVSMLGYPGRMLHLNRLSTFCPLIMTNGHHWPCKTEPALLVILVESLGLMSALLENIFTSSEKVDCKQLLGPKLFRRDCRSMSQCHTNGPFQNGI